MCFRAFGNFVDHDKFGKAVLAKTQVRKKWKKVEKGRKKLCKPRRKRGILFCSKSACGKTCGKCGKVK